MELNAREGPFPFFFSFFSCSILHPQGPSDDSGLDLTVVSPVLSARDGPLEAADEASHSLIHSLTHDGLSGVTWGNSLLSGLSYSSSSSFSSTHTYDDDDD